mmetsp:Transcript_27770/g.53563  ORF Transcript_27770/g.53563 Transcript_27770/m.53563 type:complete len:250 (-) Transcript_27770:41-790(-)
MSTGMSSSAPFVISCCAAPSVAFTSITDADVSASSTGSTSGGGGVWSSRNLSSNSAWNALSCACSLTTASAALTLAASRSFTAAVVVATSPFCLTSSATTAASSISSSPSFDFAASESIFAASNRSALCDSAASHLRTSSSIAAFRLVTSSWKFCKTIMSNWVRPSAGFSNTVGMECNSDSSRQSSVPSATTASTWLEIAEGSIEPCCKGKKLFVCRFLTRSNCMVIFSCCSLLVFSASATFSIRSLLV